LALHREEIACVIPDALPTSNYNFDTHRSMEHSRVNCREQWRWWSETLCRAKALHVLEHIKPNHTRRAGRRVADETTGRGRDDGSRARRRVTGEAAGAWRGHGEGTHGGDTTGAWRGHDVRRGHGGFTAGARRGRGAAAVAAAAWRGREHGRGRGGDEGEGTARAGRGCGRGLRRRGRGGVYTAAAVRSESERVRDKEGYQRYLHVLCRVPVIWHSAKIFFNFKIRFAECQIADTRQSILCRVSPARHSTKILLLFFTECHPTDTRQSLLCRVSTS
jgi:hypothetical protein